MAGGGETVDVGLSVDQVLGLPHHVVHGRVEATLTHRHRSHGTCLQQIFHRKIGNHDNFMTSIYCNELSSA